MPTEATFNNGTVAIDYALVNEGIVVTDTYFALVMDGTVHLANATEPAQKAKTYSTMPAHEADGAEVQLLVSEYSLNTMLLTAVELNLLNYTNSDQNSASIEMLMNNFEGTYGVHDNVTIVVNSAQENFQKYVPSIEVASGGSVITFYLDLHVRNPLDPSQDAALLLVEAKANVSFSVDGSLTLSGEVRSLDLSVVTFTPYFQTLSNAKGMNLKLTLATNMIESYANNILDNGYALPVPDSISPYIKNEKVVAKEGYLLIDGDCDFTQHLFVQAKLLALA